MTCTCSSVNGALQCLIDRLEAKWSTADQLENSAACVLMSSATDSQPGRVCRANYSIDPPRILFIIACLVGMGLG